MVRAAAESLVNRLAGLTRGGASKLDANLESAEHFKDLGSENFQAGRLAAAGSYYRSAIQLKPHFAEAHNNLGAVLRKRGKPQSAIAVFQTALMLNPRSGSTYGNLANLHERYGNIAQAESYYLKAVELEPNLFQAFVGLARIATRRQRWDDALAALTRAATISPQSVEILYQVGVVNLYKGDLTTALNTLLNAEGRAPKNADIKASLAEAYFELDRPEDADAMLERCFALEPDNTLGQAIKNKRSAEGESLSKS